MDKQNMDDIAKNYHVCRKFESLKCFQIEAHVYSHSNFIQIKLFKTSSFKNSLLSLYNVIMFGIICLVCNFIHPMSLQLKILLVFTLTSILTLFILNFIIIEESLEIIRSIKGVNYYTKNMLGKETSKFIGSTNFVINEAITMFRVISYLAVLACESNQLTSSKQVNLIFTKMLPRNDCLEFIYTHIHHFLNQN
ncbi:phosphatidylinositol N-acetylglucosaminyltransferase subunit H [Tetranychus urticae]|uniref:phosphatidylinositol N-acetylglucosaminyltransferase subunit H n=1 Tax=Tetranychus urticae TaxID=32264 RepID=UPI00077BB417|nr:phosphatidylinositol N-acetylglucosaminyltransferase subunit H [Tetranychus urticae]